MRLRDLTNQVFGRLTVLARAESKARQTRWLCRCDCGVESTVAAKDLQRGTTRSCGCLQRELHAARHTIHGHTKNRKLTSIYGTWRAIVQRCTDHNCKSFPRYGGRGITVCDRWRESFENFLADMGDRPSPRHSIDREDNSKGYEPGNCRWATPEEQGRNKRSNRMITVDGVTRCVVEWSEASGISRKAITSRLARGWSEKDAVTVPVDHRFKGERHGS
jgi:hypothetical protein